MTMIHRTCKRNNIAAGSRLSLMTHFFLVSFLGVYNNSVNAFQSRHVPLPRPSTKFAPVVVSQDCHPFKKSSLSIHSQSVEDDFWVINMRETQQEAVTTATSTTRLQWFSSWMGAPRMDRKQLTELGISFMLSYNLISNINGSVFLSLSWYISSVRTGLSPLAPGGWKVLLATYAWLYVFNTLARPFRLAVAVGVTKRVSNFLDRTQVRLGCSKAFSVGFVFTTLIAMWLGLAAAGITLASTLAGVPIWKGI